MEEKKETILNGHEAGLPLTILITLSKLTEKEVLEIIQRGRN
jgi:hypothetical protein